MRELENKYDNAHGSGDPPLITTYEPEVREDKRGNKEEKPWYKKLIDFIKNIWEWYTSSLKAFVEGFELGPAGVRVLTGFLIVFVLALVLVVITFVIMGLSKMIKTSRENIIAVENATKAFENRVVETDADMNRILKTPPMAKLKEVPTLPLEMKMPELPPVAPVKPVVAPVKPVVPPVMNVPEEVALPVPIIQPPKMETLPMPKMEPLPVPRIVNNYDNLGMSKMRFNQLAKDTFKTYRRSGLIGSTGFKEFVNEYKDALKEMRRN